MISELKQVEKIFEIRHSTVKKIKQYNFQYNGILIEINKNKFVADKTFLVLHKIFSLGISPDITVINKTNLRSYSK